MVLSFAQGRAVSVHLQSEGVIPDGAVWRWFPGLGGGVFEEHLELDGQTANDEFSFPDHPDTAVNARWCQCQIKTTYRRA